MKKLPWATLFLTALCFCGCAQSSGMEIANGAQESANGKYVEEIVELPDSSVVYAGIVQEDNTIRLLNAYGTDLISTDGGESFEKADLIRSAVRDDRYATFAFAAAADGSRLLKEWKGDRRVWELITSENEKLVLEELSGEQDAFLYVECCYGGGFFYSTDGDGKVYQTDKKNGNTLLLTETDGNIVQIAAGEAYVYILTQKGVILYDLKKECPAEQDQVLSEFLAEAVRKEGNAVFLYPYKEALYILTHEGLYRYQLYGESMEQLLDHNYGLSDMDRNFCGMAVIEEEELPVFLILYSDGRLMRYIRDPDVDASQESPLRIYSVYRDSNLSRAVSAFRARYPELNIQYDIGVDSAYGITLEDALRNLGTEIAAGNGPDILLMDNIPYSAYKEKGVLLDLTSFYEGLCREDYFTPVLEGFAEEDGLYMLPAAFILPVMSWNQEIYGTAESLSDMAELLEAARENQKEGLLISAMSASNVLRLFSQSSMGAWADREGKLDTDAVREFFYQTQRIYISQKAGITEDLAKYNLDGTEEYFTDNMWEKRFLSADICDWSFNVAFSGYSNLSFFGGHLKGSDEKLLGSYVSLFGFLDYYETNLVFMPGQEYGDCLPVTMLSVSRTTARLEESMLFLQYVFSEEFQGMEGLFGIPVNRSAYKLWQKDPRGAGQEKEMLFSLEWGDNTAYFYWPAQESFKELDSLIDHMTGVHFCEGQVYSTVMEMGEAALEGKYSIEEAVAAVEKALQLYLAE